MTLKKILTLVTLGSTVTSLVACSQPQKPRHSAKKRPLTIMQSDSEPTQDPKVRLQFNDIKTATVQDNFQNGTTLEQIKSFYGEPKTHTTKPAGDVTLDVYTWTIDKATITVQLFQNSTVAKAISNFAFERKKTITETIYTKEIQNGMTFTRATEILGQADVYSQSVSSDGEEIQAIWSSNLKGTDNARHIKLIFKDGKLVEKSQYGLN